MVDTAGAQITVVISDGCKVRIVPVEDESLKVPEGWVVRFGAGCTVVCPHEYWVHIRKETMRTGVIPQRIIPS